MSDVTTIKINFTGGIISPGELYDILNAAAKRGVLYVRFGLRQQLLIDVQNESLQPLIDQLRSLGTFFETGTDNFPNITSSYPAEEVFIHHTWLSEGVYKDIFDNFDRPPKLKINISDSNQSFTPMLTGNINWVASAEVPHFWHLFMRFPKTNVVFEWSEMVYTNDVAKLSLDIEKVIFENKGQFYDNASAKGDLLFDHIAIDNYVTRPSAKPAELPAFNLPYYEGLNRYNNKYWLGIYRRDELFSVSLLRELCTICLHLKIGQFCSTPWKSIIVKGIEEKDRQVWNRLLEKHQVNVRHAANELNFQVEDNCNEGLQLKNYLVNRLNSDDTRTFGVCIGIKTRKKSEVFSSILVRRKSLINIFGFSMLHLYDILCARNFNPNERTGFVYSRNNPRFLLGEQLRRAIIAYYQFRNDRHLNAERQMVVQKQPNIKRQQTPKQEYVYQCRHCLTAAEGDLAKDYTCSVCEAPAQDFVMVAKEKLGLQPI